MLRNRIVYGLLACNVFLLAVVGMREAGVRLPGGIDSLARAAVTTSTLSTSASRRTILVDAAEKIGPSVVSVGASRSQYFVSPYARFFRDFTIFEQEKEVPYLGSGVIIDPDGLVVTNYHVVEDTKDVFVTLVDGRRLPGKVLDADVALDIALIKVDGKNLPAAKLGNSDDLLVGEWTLAMGNPFGTLIDNPTPTVTAGVISALNRNFRPSQDIPRVYLDMIQTDAAINPGNSGGALANAAGEIIGINTFIVSRSGGAEGIGFAIPINRVKAVVEEIVKHGKIRPRLVDFQTSTLNNRMGRMLNTNAENGAVVTEVRPDGPASKAGLKVGDVITMVNGVKVADSQDLRLKVWYNRQVGSKFRFTIDRSGRPVDLEYQLVAPPDDED